MANAEYDGAGPEKTLSLPGTRTRDECLSSNCSGESFLQESSQCSFLY